MSADGYTEFTLETLQTPDGINQINRVIRELYDNIAGDSEGIRVFNGYGSPEGVVSAGIGSIYLRADGGSGTSVYRKESDSGGNTGWVANSNITLPLSVANGGTGADFSSGVTGKYLGFTSTGVFGQITPPTPVVLPSSAAGDIVANTIAGTNISPTYTCDTERTSTANSFTKQKSIMVPRGGTLRIKFDMKTSTGATNAHARVYRNGSAAGTDQTQDSTYTTKSEDISGWTAGDECQLYVRNGSADMGITLVKNFRIYELAPPVYMVIYDTST